MSDLYNQIISQRGSFERLVARIPGFRGYQDSQARRKADRMLRDHIAAQLEERVQAFTRIEKKILDKGGLAHMSRTREVKTKLQSYVDRVKAAAPGYRGLWSSVKIGPEELERIYSFDEAQIRYADRISAGLTDLDKAVDTDMNVDPPLDALYAIAVEAHQAFSLREDVLTNLDKSL